MSFSLFPSLLALFYERRVTRIEMNFLFVTIPSLLLDIFVFTWSLGEGRRAERQGRNHDETL
jgi:hypothetical protein